MRSKNFAGSPMRAHLRPRSPVIRATLTSLMAFLGKPLTMTVNNVHSAITQTRHEFENPVELRNHVARIPSSLPEHRGSPDAGAERPDRCSARTSATKIPPQGP